MKALLIVAALLCSTEPAFCQASWTYRVGFALNNEKGQPVHDYDITAGKYQVFIGKDKPIINYVSPLGLFYITGSAISPGISIGLINGRDTTLVVLPVVEERVILSNWPTKPGTYVLEVDFATGQLSHPEALQYYPPRFWGNRDSLFSLTILDWDKYRVDRKSDKYGGWFEFPSNNKAKVQNHD